MIFKWFGGVLVKIGITSTQLQRVAVFSFDFVEVSRCGTLINLIPVFSIKVGLSPSKNTFFICFNDSPSKMMKNAFYFILKALFVLKIFRFLS